MSGERERLPDEELVRRTRSGDRQAFDTLVQRYVRAALAVALEYTSRREDAEDVVQDAFHRALRQLDRFDDRLAFRPWFFTIVRNLGRNLAVRGKRWRTVPLPAGLAAERPGPFEDAHRAEVREHLLDEIESLPEMQRACFRLCDMEGFTGPEVAEMLGITPGTARTHLHRARRAMRHALRSFAEDRGVHNDD